MRTRTLNALVFVGIPVASAAVMFGALTGCGPADPNVATTEDRAAFALAWSQQTDSDKDSVCLLLAIQGEHGVAEQATEMDRPQVFAALLADQCETEGR